MIPVSVISGDAPDIECCFFRVLVNFGRFFSVIFSFWVTHLPEVSLRLQRCGRMRKIGDIFFADFLKFNFSNSESFNVNLRCGIVVACLPRVHYQQISSAPSSRKQRIPHGVVCVCLLKKSDFKLSVLQTLFTSASHNAPTVFHKESFYLPTYLQCSSENNSIPWIPPHQL